MKVIVACGGTSGHVNPAIAIANEIKNRHPDAEILFFGTKTNIEASLVPKAGYDIEFISANGFTRKMTFKAIKHNIKALNTFFATARKVRKKIKEFNPDVAIGTGGFVSAPVLFAAAKMKIPTAIHEQNCFAGVATQMLAKRVDKIFLSFPISNKLDADDSKQMLVGNPAKQEFFTAERSSARAALGIGESEKVVLSVGGSLGARKINDAFCRMAERTSEEERLVLHHGASRDYDYVLGKIGDKAEHKNIHVYNYIYNMSELMAAADLIISRSGAGALTEIAALGRASILIPSPNVAENHQYFNAKTFADKGAAVLIEEKDLDGDKLYDLVCDLCNDGLKLKQMGAAAKTFASPETAKIICDEIDKMID